MKRELKTLVHLDPYSPQGANKCEHPYVPWCGVKHLFVQYLCKGKSSMGLSNLALNGVGIFGV